MLAFAALNVSAVEPDEAVAVAVVCTAYQFEVPQSAVPPFQICVKACALRLFETALAKSAKMLKTVIALSLEKQISNRFVSMIYCYD